MGSSGMEGNQPCPISILNFKEPEDRAGAKVVTLEEDNLKEVMRQAGDRPVVVISIVGPSRRGKSFFLGFVIRYLEALEDDNSDWMDFEDKDKPLSGFKWRGGIDHETSGMMMWSRPFIVKSNNREVAVLLIDTQGTFDETTTQREWSAIVGLSLLCSSITIFNSFTDLQEDVLNFLDSYIQYGLMALGGNDEGATGAAVVHPFQRLFFLIRDWNTPAQYAYGAKGGKAFLEKKLEVRTEQQSPNAQEIRKKIRQCFSQIDCFLMPDPGEKAKAENFDGRISQLTTNYCKKVEELVSDLMNPDDLHVKSIFGSEIMACDFVNYFQEYVRTFNMEELPQPTTMMAATAKIMHLNLVQKFKKMYLELMKKKLRGKPFVSESQMDKFHEICRKETLKEYGNVKKLGAEDLVKEYEEELALEIKDIFSNKLCVENASKKSKIVDDALRDAAKTLKDNMNAEFESDDSFVSEKRLIGSLETEKSAIITDLKEKLSSMDESDLDKTIELYLEPKLEEVSQQVLTTNKTRKLQAEQKLTALVTTTARSYAREMISKLEDDPFMTQEDFQESNTNEQITARKAFEKAKKTGSKDFIKTYTKQLDEELEKSSTNEVVGCYERKLQEVKSAAEAVTTTLIEAHFLNQSASLEKFLGFSEDKLKNYYEEIKKNCLKELEMKSPYPTTCRLHQDLLKKFKPQLDSKCSDLINDITARKMKCEASYKESVEAALSEYKDRLKTFVDDNLYLSNDDLHNEHLNIKVKAEELHRESPKVGCYPHPEMYEEKLYTSIDEYYEQVSIQNVEKRALLESETKNLEHDCLDEYQNSIMQQMDKLKDVDELEDFHRHQMSDMETQFKSKCKVKNDEFVTPYLDRLVEGIDAMFLEDIKDIFDLKLSERSSGTNNAMNKARKYYREEMEKNFKNDEFLRPKDLEALHERLSKKAVETCADETPLSELQKKDLFTELAEVYKEFKDQNAMNVPTDPAIGIDLGTTYSCVAVYINGKTKIISNALGNNTTPSYVCYNDAGNADVIGEQAKKKAYEDAENTIYDAKRIIGRDFDDEKLQKDMKLWPFTVINDSKVPKIQINGKSYFPEQVSSEVLKEMRVVAEKYLNCTVRNAVITVPAYFTDGQRQATKDAGELAGLKVLTVLTEPVAAAVAYKLQRTDDTFRHVLIYDLGGGTFDVAVLKIGKNDIETLSVDGDTHLGGEDFDQEMMMYCCLEFQLAHGIDLFEGKDSDVLATKQKARRRLQRLQLECEVAKIALASARTVTIALDAIWTETSPALDLNVEITRDSFETMNETLFQKTIEIVERVLKSAGVSKDKIEDIVLVGGSTRIPAVQEILSKFFDGKTLNKQINPDEAVAYGAAVQAAIMNGEIAQESVDFNKIQDVTPMSMGIEVYGGGFSIIIPKNTKVPAKLKEQYLTAHNNQTSVQITIYQGEDVTKATNNTWLGEFYLNNIPPADAGRETIDVWMEINLQGILNITAACTSTGETDSIKVTEHKRRMGKEEIKRILAEAKPGAA